MFIALGVVCILTLLACVICHKYDKTDLFFVPKLLYRIIFVIKPEDRLSSAKALHELFPRYMRFKFFNLFDVLIVYDPDLLKKVFNSHAACQRPFRNCLQHNYGLLSSEYHYWKGSRKHLNIAFNLNVIKGFVPIFSDYADGVVKDMQEHLDGEEFDLLFPLAQLTARTVAATVLNVRGIEVPSYQKLIDSINETLGILHQRIVTPFWNYNFIFNLTKTSKREAVARKFVTDYGDQLIDAARKRKKPDDTEFDENGNELQKKDLKINYIIDQLINHEEKFTNEEVRDHTFTLLITASETSANLVATCILYMAIHQDIQQKMYEEICEVLCDENMELDYDNINSLKYLEMVIKETLRLFTPVPLTARELVEELDIGLKSPLIKGAIVFPFYYVLHRRRDLWGKNSCKFNPENFSPENISARDPYAFLPFAAGPRNCIGNRYAYLSAKIEVMKLIQAYRFTTKIKEKDIKMVLSFTGKLSQKHMVSIAKRD